MLEPGQLIDRYVIHSLIGQGGMAAVYRVTHVTLKSSHALKVLTMQRADVRERLVSEGQVQASLDHPNVLTVTDVIDVDGSPGLVMELIEGPNLEDWILTNPPTEDRQQVLRQVISAVATAHDNGLVHRDLKPANVLLKHGPNGLQAKVADFGLVKALLDESIGASHRATRSGLAMGTPQYMSPEQINDASTVDARADVFSLGCILQFCYTGEPAFAGDTPLEIFAAIGASRPLPIPNDLPPSLTNCIRTCLKSNPDHRFQHAGELLLAMDDPSTHPPVAHTMDLGTLDLGRPNPTTSAGRKNLGIGLWLLVLGISMGGLLALGLALLLFARTQPDSREELPRAAQVLPAPAAALPSTQTPQKSDGDKADDPQPSAAESPEDSAAIEPCNAQTIEGYARIPRVSVTPVGVHFMVLKNTTVYRSPKGLEKVCVLPRRSVIRIRKRPLIGKRYKWVKVPDGGVTIP